MEPLIGISLTLGLRSFRDKKIIIFPSHAYQSTNDGFHDGVSPIINLPLTHQDQFISRFKAPKLNRERTYQFSSESITKFKAKANAESNTNKISSFQTFFALVCRCITRLRCLPHDQITHCELAINNRSRLELSLSNDYFGNSLYTVGGVTTVVELLEHNLGWRHGSCMRLWLISLTKLCATFLIPGCSLILFCNLLSFLTHTM